MWQQFKFLIQTIIQLAVAKVLHPLSILLTWVSLLITFANLWTLCGPCVTTVNPHQSNLTLVLNQKNVFAISIFYIVATDSGFVGFLTLMGHVLQI